VSCTSLAIPTRQFVIAGRWDPGRHFFRSRSPPRSCSRRSAKSWRSAFSAVGIAIAFLAGHDRDLYVHARHTGARPAVPDLRVVADLSAKRSAWREPCGALGLFRVPQLRTLRVRAPHGRASAHVQATELVLSGVRHAHPAPRRRAQSRSRLSMPRLRVAARAESDHQPHGCAAAAAGSCYYGATTSPHFRSADVLESLSIPRRR